MPVYVDNMRAPYRGMIMCHMVADTSDELLAMADQIGIQRRWIQKPGTYQEHFDIPLDLRAAALRAGAVEISRRQLGEFLSTRRAKMQGSKRTGNRPV